MNAIMAAFAVLSFSESFECEFLKIENDLCDEVRENVFAELFKVRE